MAGFGMYNLQKVEKNGFGQFVYGSVCPSVGLSVRLAVAFVANSHGRKGELIELKF